MNYKESVHFLFSSLPMYQRLGAAAYKNDLSTSLELDRRHNHPHESFRSIHIAGTNGKGSVSHMIAAIFQSAGLKTGLYTSPHLKDFRERIRINGKMISQKEVINYLENNSELIHDLKPSFFEMTVDLAFLYFHKQKVDVAVIETGMGGRLDSTNIIKPEVSVITNIGLDHTHFLGDNLPDIAKEKAGIIKRNIPVVIGEKNPETLPVFTGIAVQMNAELFIAEDRYSVELSLMNTDRTADMQIVDRENNQNFHLTTDLTGKYQEKNILTVLQTIEVLKSRGVNISNDHIASGLKQVKKLTGFRGRWEETGYNPLTIFDTAHNAEGIREVTRQLESLPRKKLHIVWGMVSDKNAEKILKLLPREAVYYFTKADIPRSMNEKILLEMAVNYGLKGNSYQKSADALNDARKKAAAEDIIFVGGSTFLVGELL